jgi:hypothetical protein
VANTERRSTTPFAKPQGVPPTLNPLAVERVSATEDRLKAELKAELQTGPFRGYAVEVAVASNARLG